MIGRYGKARLPETRTAQRVAAVFGLTFAALALAVVPAIPGVGQEAQGQEAQQWPSDEWLERPVDDATFQAFLGFFAYDPQLPFGIEVLDESESDGVHVEHLSFQSTPGVRVTTRLYRQSGSEAGRPGVILLHGGLPAGKDSRGNVNIARLIARAGWDVLAIDMLHFGERDTGLLETFTNPEKAERLYTRQGLYLEWVTQTVKDVGRSYDLLVDEGGTDPARVVLVGISRGGQMAFIAGGAEPRLAGVAALIAGHFDAIETAHRAAACPANYIGRISPRPFLMISGEFDADYDKEKSVLPLQALAGEPKELHWNDTGHTLPRESTATTLLDWLRRVPPR